MDLTDIQAFYHQPLGKSVFHCLFSILSHALNRRSGPLLGLGYPLPYLSALKRPSCATTFAVMLARMGVTHWPSPALNASLLCQEDLLPFPDGVFETIFVIHGMEFLTHPDLFLDEAWRILAPSGRLWIVTPNRRGLWAQMDQTPFGHGHPYSKGQLNRLLSSHRFSPCQELCALFFPPSAHPLLLKTAPLFETWGKRLRFFSGVFMTEAEKRTCSPLLIRPMNMRWHFHPPHVRPLLGAKTRV